ncbi:MAG: ribonuclease HI [Selenomonadaceae bacterium]|nr:ribonuclease HI [Selenomonadaceae bacterium]
MSSFTIYTDGSCLNNPGPGGWAAVITDNVTGEREEISGGVKYTTNNRMELMAAISALEKTDEGDSAEIFTDSAYLKKAFNDGWLENWKRNGWITTNKKNVSNQDLWQELDELVSKRDVVFRWVKGHSGTSGNEWCDKLARAAAVNSVIKNSNEDKTETLKLTDSLFGEDFNLPTKYLKIAKKLQMKKYRQEFNFFVAEGLRLCEMALSSTKIEFGFFTEEFLKNERAEELVKKLQVLTKLYKIPSDTFDKISDTQTPQGILLVLRQNLSTPEDVAKKSPIIVLDGVQDPGNVGTILRTAEAFDCAVILLEGSADIYNSKVVRSSMGAIFSLPVALMTREEFLTFAQIKKFEVSATVLDPSAEIYFKHKFKKKSAIVFGSEANGVSEEISDSAKKIFIPMQGTAESLNVSTAAGIIISEIVRQRS